MLADKRRERDTLLRRVMAPYPMRINRNRLDTLYGMTRSDTTAKASDTRHPQAAISIKKKLLDQKEKNTIE